MNKLYISETSQWLKNIILSNNKQINGKVLAVFDHSIAIKINGPGLIHISNNGDNLSPFSIATTNIILSNIYENQPVILNKNLLLFNNYLLECSSFTPSFNQSAIDYTDISDIIIENTVNMSDIFENKFNYHRNGILNSLKNNDLLLFEQEILSLIGSGEGLTPAGDDYIVGILFGLYYQKRNNIINVLHNNLPVYIEHKTNLISKTFINHA
ncbi:MAG: DUF2877 domain-containing protein, partial [Cyanobacteriota bacterium]